MNNKDASKFTCHNRHRWDGRFEKRWLHGASLEHVRQVCMIEAKYIRVMVRGYDEPFCSCERDIEASQILEPDAMKSPDVENALYIANADARDSQQQTLRSAIHIDGKEMAMADRPRELRVFFEIEVATIETVRHFMSGKTVITDQPIGFVQTVFAHWRSYGFAPEFGIRIGSG